MASFLKSYFNNIKLLFLFPFISLNLQKKPSMKKIILAVSLVALLTTSCGTKKKIAALESKNKEIQDLLNTCSVKLNMCLTEKEAVASQIEFL